MGQYQILQTGDSQYALADLEEMVVITSGSLLEVLLYAEQALFGACKASTEIFFDGENIAYCVEEIM